MHWRTEKSLKTNNWKHYFMKTYARTNWLSRIIRNWSHNSFETYKRIRNNSKARTSGTVRVEAERRRTASCHMWTAASTAGKVSFFLYRIMTDDEKKIHYDNSMRRRSCGKPGHASISATKPNIHGSKRSVLHFGEISFCYIAIHEYVKCT